MKDISITNGFITGIVPFGNGVKITFTEGAVVLLDGAAPEATAPAATQPAFVPGVGGGTGEGNGGGVGGARPETVQTGASRFNASATVAFVKDGETPIRYAAGEQQRTHVTGVSAALTAYGFTVTDARPGSGTISLAQAETGDCAGVFAISTERGATEGDNVLAQYKGNMPVFHYQVGSNKPGYGPELVPGTKYYVNALYMGNPGTDQIVEIAGHRRGG